MYDQHHLRSSITFAMHKTKPGILTAGAVKNNLKGTIEKFIMSVFLLFLFMNSVKGILASWRQFLYDVLAVVKQLGIPIYFLTLSCADLRSEEVPYIVNKLNNTGLNEEELKKKGRKNCVIC